MMSPASDPLAATARWTAAARAIETMRGDRLFDDPWAADLAGPEGRAWIETRPAESVLPIVLRTRYFDDWVASATTVGAITQVVILGAGLDTRAYRLGLPADTVLFEVDRADILEHKAATLARAGVTPCCERRAVIADLAGDWSRDLTAAGLAVTAATAWLLEGLLFYLPVEAVGRILDEVSALAASGSRLAFDIVNHAVLTSEWTRSWVEMQAAAGAPWLGTMEDPVAALASRGWSASLTSAGQPDAHHGRWQLPVIPTTMAGMPHHWFVTAERPA